MIGEVLGHYQIVDRLGEGGMGEVFRARDQTLDRMVAIKVLLPELSRDPKAVERFQSEAKTLARLQHQNLAQIHAYFNLHGRYYIVMEYLDGRSIQTVLRDLVAVEPRVAIEWMNQAMLGIHYAHRQHRVIHRDLKPANLFLTRDHVIKVVDFGIAYTIGADRLTRTGYPIGSPAYMAPEQFFGKPADPRTDIYGAGAVLFELLSGRTPYDGATFYDLLLAHTNQPIPALPSHLPPVLQQVVNKALAKEPEARFDSMESFRRELVAIYDNRSLSLAPPSIVSQAAISQPPPIQASMSPAPALTFSDPGPWGPTPTMPPQPSLLRSGRTSWWVGGAALFAGVVVVATILGLAPRAGEPSLTTLSLTPTTPVSNVAQLTPRDESTAAGPRATTTRSESQDESWSEVHAENTSASIDVRRPSKEASVARSTKSSRASAALDSATTAPATSELTTTGTTTTGTQRKKEVPLRKVVFIRKSDVHDEMDYHDDPRGYHVAYTITLPADKAQVAVEEVVEILQNGQRLVYKKIAQNQRGNGDYKTKQRIAATSELFPGTYVMKLYFVIDGVTQETMQWNLTVSP